MRAFHKAVLIVMVAVMVLSCTEEDHLTGAIESAWGEMETEIEESAEEALEEYADNPKALYKGDCEAEYFSLGNLFTITIPVDEAGYAVVGLIFGSETADLLSMLDDNNRNSKSKADIRKMILKNFTPDWARLMSALVILDGEFDYEFENVSWSDASYEFNSKDLYKILTEKGFFSGVYGDTLP